MVIASFHGSPLSKRGSLWAWCVCKVPVKRWLCVLRSGAHREQNSSVTPAELGLCSTADARESVGRTHRSSMFGSWLGAMHQLGAQGDWVTVGGSKQASVYTFTPANTRTTAKIEFRHKQTSVRQNTCMHSIFCPS